MTKSIRRGPSSVIFMNASLLEYSGTGNQRLLLINNSLVQVQLKEPYRDSQLNELLYVIIVIVFYATALMTLIITQIKRQRHEGTDVDYYDEYLQRNSEVKQTCQVASSIVSRKTHQPPPALATAAFAAAAAGTLLGRVPLKHEDILENVSDEDKVDTGEITQGDMSVAFSGGLGSRSPYPRDRSPMLESIPDVEG